MARGKYYIVKDGERLYRDSVSAIAKLAQKFADEIGGSVTVFEDHTGLGFGGRKKGVVKAMRRNPAPSRVYEVIDTLDNKRVVATFPTHRRAFNYTRKIEPEPSVKTKGYRGMDWRYLIRPRNA